MDQGPQQPALAAAGGDEPASGDRIGAYRVLRRLGSGAMGVVYEALNESIDKRVAIKVLSSQHSVSKEQLQRFQNEARATSRVNHPGIVNIFEFGRLPEGTAYLVMEYLEGQTLEDRLRGERGPLREALRFGHQIASALCAAHEQGVVHRDLKPANVMLVKDPELPGQERVKVLDFGIAKLGTTAPEGTSTRTDAVMGTPAYMAPEQCRGAGHVTAQSDVYSLGAMLYECLSGARPLQGATAVEVMYKQIQVSPEPLGKRRPDLPPEILTLVDGMLAKRPEVRPTMARVAQVLAEHAGRGRDTSGRSASPWGQSLGPAGRALRGPALVAGALALLCAGAGLWRWRSGGAADDGGRAPPPAVVQGAESPRTQGTMPAPATPPVQPGTTVTATPPVKARARWALTTEPPGAEVLRGGERLGTTPWERELDATAGEDELILRLRGYYDVKVRMDRSANTTRHEVLRARRAAQPERMPRIEVPALDPSALPRRPR